jgi:hypothetical protein
MMKKTGSTIANYQLNQQSNSLSDESQLRNSHRVNILSYRQHELIKVIHCVLQE